MGMVVKNGAAKPDISSVGTFKRTLTSRHRRVFRPRPWRREQCLYLAKLLERLEIAEQAKLETKHPPQGGNAAVLVADGEVELPIQPAPEVISGVKFHRRAVRGPE